ncbi:MAG: FeoA family protein [Butyribacter sp.]|nr:FeoA family protein [bacterium]MDY3854858.1 FeoA family protein [Butyribacter sp.]
MTLDELPVGKEAIVSAVGGEGALRCRFLDMGLIPRTKVSVIKVAPMGDPVEIRLRGYELTIRKEDAKMIEIVMEDTK